MDIQELIKRTKESAKKRTREEKIKLLRETHQ